MIILCENCDTRFQLDESRIPAEGARVRCSRCQHRFHVESPSGAPPPAPELDPSEERTVEDTGPLESGSGLAAPSEDEPDLENPEFLYDGRATRNRGRTPEDESAAARAELDPAGLDLSEPEEGEIGASFDPDADPEPVSSEAESGGISESLDWDDDLFDSADDEIDPFAGIGAPGLGPQGGGGSDEAPSVLAPKPALLERPTASVSALEDSGAGRRLWSAVAIVAVLLGVGACRGVAVLGAGPTPGPERFEGAGWVAHDLESFHLRDAEGRRVLVVRGALRGTGAAPELALELRDAMGEPVETLTWVAARRLTGVDLEPAALAGHVEEALSGAGDAGSAHGPVRAFTALVVEPPLEARRYSIRLAGR